MVVPIIICCIKEVLTAKGGRGHATISKHLSNMLTENYLRVTHTFPRIVYYTVYYPYFGMIVYSYNGLC